jgi:UDP-N-acetylglucosamine/UDP-N-acetyl-alpha-D-glucosaminouronate 4-epimerase
MSAPWNVLVTGGAGFIGSNLTEALVGAGHDVRVLDDLSTGAEENLAAVEGSVQLIRGDVRDPGAVTAAVAGRDVVFHLAALPRVSRSVSDPVLTHDVNVTGTLQVLLAARDASIRRMVYASSSSVYGDTPTLPKLEDMAPLPRSPYAAGKLAGEAYCRAFAAVFAMETVSLRFFNVFGPRQDPRSQYAAVIPRFVARMLAGLRPEVFGDGRQTRDFSYVDNVVNGCIRAAEAGPRVAGEVMNVACGERISVLELVEAINDLLGTNLEPQFGEPRAGDVRDSLASIEKAERLLGYRPSVQVREGLRRTVRSFDGRPALARGVR